MKVRTGLHSAFRSVHVVDLELNFQTHLAPRIRKTRTCWLWYGPLDRKGYGRVYGRNLEMPAHRAVFELLVHPIETGMTIDHLCQERMCVNPKHLEVVSVGVNAARRYERNPYCKRGHLLEGATVGVSRTATTSTGNLARFCQLCRRVVKMRAYWKSKNRLAEFAELDRLLR